MHEVCGAATNPEDVLHMPYYRFLAWEQALIPEAAPGVQQEVAARDRMRFLQKQAEAARSERQ